MRDIYPGSGLFFHAESRTRITDLLNYQPGWLLRHNSSDTPHL
jgi:hypothetical protein